MPIDISIYPMPFSPADRKDWPAGPWDNEPDNYSWIDPTTDYRCAILRNRMGALCGYVRVPEDHKLFGKDYTEEIDFLLQPKSYGDRIDCIIDCHGGLTYSNREGWFGFDCSHVGDVRPEATWRSDLSILLRRTADVYRDFNYVKSECASLAYELWKFDKTVPF